MIDGHHTYRDITDTEKQEYIREFAQQTVLVARWLFEDDDGAVEYRGKVRIASLSISRDEFTPGFVGVSPVRRRELDPEGRER